jgi:type IV secretory pathway ATPase VirB11/archaellum biosynthesis ATPase
LALDNFQRHLNQEREAKTLSYRFKCFEVTVIQNKIKSELEYQVSYDVKTMRELKNFDLYGFYLKENLKKFILDKQDFSTFDELFKYIINLHESILGFPKFLLIPILFRALNLERICPLLLDEQIDEIYLDSGDKPLYIDHKRFGRCLSNIYLTKKEIQAFTHRIAIENDFILNRENPTLKGDFVSELFHTRVTIDLPPLLLDDIHIDIRKFHSKKFRISDLINLGSITIAQAEFLKCLMQNLVSISIIGPPNSGKTTLQNALIDHIHPQFRVLSIEDVLETSSLRKGNRIRFRLGYDPNENSIYSKAMEIQKILHRSPDYVNLGELSTQNHFIAFLNVLSVGIPSIQTIHGRKPQQLVTRLRDIYNIPINLIKTSFPHVFIELRTNWINNIRKRYVHRIMELTEEGNIINISESNFCISNNVAINKKCSETINYVLNNQKDGSIDSEEFNIVYP